jgi:FkbM family methyltransferase
MDPAFRFRPGTSDEEIFRNVIEHNEYRLPDRFPTGAIIIDIGAHIGSFAYAVSRRGAQRVYSFEADPDNHRLADENLRRFAPNVQLRHAAVWRSDVRIDHLTISTCPEPTNTGWREVFGDAGAARVPAIPLDEIIREVTNDGRRRIHLLKIDCEGSEFPILMTSQLLHLVDRMVGEWHEIQTEANPEPIPAVARVAGVERFGREELCQAIERFGFEFWSRHYPPSRLGLFEARRSPHATAPTGFRRVMSGLARRWNAVAAAS